MMIELKNENITNEEKNQTLSHLKAVCYIVQMKQT